MSKTSPACFRPFEPDAEAKLQRTVEKVEAGDAITLGLKGTPHVLAAGIRARDRKIEALEKRIAELTKRKAVLPDPFDTGEEKPNADRDPFD